MRFVLYRQEILLERGVKYNVTLSRRGESKFRWSPSRSGSVDNKEVDDAARTTSNRDNQLTVLAVERVQENSGVICFIKEDRSEDPNPFDTTRLPG
jgi:hypothetical protein